MPTPASSARGHPPPLPSSTETIGCAATATTALTGTSSTTVQVSSADEICLAEAPARPAGPASTGTTTEASAPPSTMS